MPITSDSIREHAKLFSREQFSSPAMLSLILCHSEPQRMSDIATECHMSAAGATVLIDSLEKKGLVERKHDEQDRRQVQVSLTPEGRELVDSILKQPHETVS